MHSAFDRQTALARLGGDFDVLIELAELFVAELPSLLADLNVAVGQNQPETIRRATHKIKSGSSNFFAASVTQAIARVDECAESGNLDETFDAARSLTTELQRLAAELTRFAENSNRK